MSNELVIEAGDYRRAGVITMHHRRGNVAGMLAVVSEVNTAGRAVQLLLALLSLHGTFFSRLRTEDAFHLLESFVHGLAVHDADTPTAVDVARAAQVLEHHANNDVAGISRVMAAATSDGRPTEVVVHLLGTYELVLPELGSVVGMKWLEEQIDGFRVEEFRVRRT